jgi:hypothetical protein
VLPDGSLFVYFVTTEKLQVKLLAQSSMAVQETVFVPSGSGPGGGVQVTFGVPPQVSVAVGCVYCTAPFVVTVLAPRLATFVALYEPV